MQVKVVAPVDLSSGCGRCARVRHAVAHPRRSRPRPRCSARSPSATTKRFSSCPLVALGPDLSAGGRIDQVDVDSQRVASPLQAPLEQVAHAEIARDVLRLHCAVPVAERRVGRDHEQGRELREVGDDLVGDAVGEVGLLRVVQRGSRTAARRSTVAPADPMGLTGTSRPLQPCRCSSQCRSRRGCRSATPSPPPPQRSPNVFSSNASRALAAHAAPPHLGGVERE